MNHFIRLTDFSKEEIYELFKITDKVRQGRYDAFFKRENGCYVFSKFQYPYESNI